MLMPRQPVPILSVETLDNDHWSVAADAGKNFTLVVFYRGLHCPVCSKYLADLNRKADKFAERGVEVIAISCDPEERVRLARHDWGLDSLRLGYDLSIEKAREWGLYISTSRGKTSIGIMEPDLFAEPGLFLVKPDGTLYWGDVQTMPFARPHFAEVLGGLDFALDKNYQARGEA